MSAARSPSRDLFDLSGRRAVVTGSSRGLGKSIAMAFAEHGADVVIASRKRDACEAVAAEVADRFGVKTLAVACNVSRWADCDQLVDEVNAAWGGIDVLVNNAGMSPLYPTVADITEELFNKVLAVNLIGPFRLMARVGSEMMQRGGGSIVNVSSNGAIRPTADVVPYAAAKAALNNMTESMAAALGPTVRVNTIMPGRFATDIAAHWDPEMVRRAVAGHALGRVGQPDEVAGAALYFASDASSFCTAAVLRLDGGVP
jgi:NAD(P)-dependent dehydrogenase (short-subunit alcohol dehydrogenase family)